MTKHILPVVVGAMSAMILIRLCESGVHALYPMPFSTAVLALLLVNYMVCSFIGGIISTLVAGRISAIPAIVIGIVLTLAGLYNVINLPQPLWFSIVNLLVYLPFSYAGCKVVQKKI